MPNSNAAFAATRVPEEMFVDGNTFQAYSMLSRSTSLGDGSDIKPMENICG